MLAHMSWYALQLSLLIELNAMYIDQVCFEKKAKVEKGDDMLESTASFPPKTGSYRVNKVHRRNLKRAPGQVVRIVVQQG